MNDLCRTFQKSLYIVDLICIFHDYVSHECTQVFLLIYSQKILEVF